mgnify:CR=1 FL=1|tara:strand:- start:2762 stop:3394 length:633 start_codon:yes stop_codon:yes gene_type:complete
MLDLRDIHYQPATGNHVVLRGINLKAYQGKPIIISGESGSGKTTLIEIISGLIRPQKGVITWQREPLTQRQRRWLCGVVFQFPERYFLGLTVGQELRLGHRKLSTKMQLEVLNKVGLTDIGLKLAPEKLSGGQQRRLALATQLLRTPSILILDEPTAGLDWSVREEIVSLLKVISNEKLLIIMSHEKELFSKWSASTYKLVNGILEKQPK